MPRRTSITASDYLSRASVWSIKRIANDPSVDSDFNYAGNLSKAANAQMDIVHDETFYGILNACYRP
jgi:hypothetical protein